MVEKLCGPGAPLGESIGRCGRACLTVRLQSDGRANAPSLVESENSCWSGRFGGPFVLFVVIGFNLAFAFVYIYPKLGEQPTHFVLEPFRCPQH